MNSEQSYAPKSSAVDKMFTRTQKIFFSRYKRNKEEKGIIRKKQKKNKKNKTKTNHFKQKTELNNINVRALKTICCWNKTLRFEGTMN